MFTMLASVDAPDSHAVVAGCGCRELGGIAIRTWRWVAAILLASALGGDPATSVAFASEATEPATADLVEVAEPPSSVPAPDEATTAEDAAVDAQVPTANGETAAEEAVPVSESEVAKSPAETTASPASLRDVGSPTPAAPDAPLADSQAARPVEPTLESRLLEEPVAPVTHIHYLAKNRPAWLDSKPVVDGDVHRISVKAGPHYRMRQCLMDLDEELRAATAEFIDEQLGSDRASKLVSFRLDEIKNRCVRETFEEQLETSVGLMNQAHALLVFDRPFVNELQNRWQRIKALVRLLQVGLGAAVVLLLLSAVFAYFRLDTATKGYYTGRLQLMTGVAILTLLAAGILAARWIPWM